MTLLSTQKKKVENTACFANAITERKFFSELAKQLANRGVTDVLRKGFRYISELFDMVAQEKGENLWNSL